MLIAVVNHLDERDVGQDKEKVKSRKLGTNSAKLRGLVIAGLVIVINDITMCV